MALGGIVDLGGQLSRIGDTLQQNTELSRQKAAYDAISAAKLPDGTMDYKLAANIALQHGYPQIATTLAGIENQHAQRQLQERQIKLQEYSAIEKPQVVWQEDDNGDKVPYLQTPRTGPNGERTYSVRRIALEDVPGAVPGAPGQPGAPSVTPGPRNPYASGAKTTDEQYKNQGWATRMFEAERVLADPNVMQAASSPLEKAKGAIGEAVPFGLARSLPSDEFLKFDQAQRNFINAVLRRESGAAINEGEFRDARANYLPQPNDPPEVLAQKAATRRAMIAAVAGGAGRAYTPAYLFDENGKLYPNPRYQPPTGAGGTAPQRVAPPPQPPQPPQPAPAVGSTEPIQPKLVPTQTVTKQRPPPEAIAALRANPQRAAEFDAKYGTPGLAASLLAQ